MKNLFLFGAFSFYFSFGSIGQTINRDFNLNGDSFQYGGAIKLTYEIQKLPNFRLSIAGGIGKELEGISNIYPTFHLDLQMYNGGIGASLLKSQREKLHFDLNTSVMIISGFDKVNEKDLAVKFSPINYFSTNSATPLYNPFNWSFSLGTNYIVFSDKSNKNQFVGALNANFGRLIQVTYYNDGAPWGNILSDGYDRYHTGGGAVSYYGNFNDEINFLEVSYQRFTGYTENSFEIANHLQLDFIPYKDKKQYYYNQSKYNFKVANYTKGYSGSFYLYNFGGDAQDNIHYIINCTYHPNTIDSQRMGVSLEYLYSNTITK